MTELPDDINKFIDTWNAVDVTPNKKPWQSSNRYHKITENVKQHRELALLIKKEGESFSVDAKKNVKEGFQKRKLYRQNKDIYNFDDVGSNIKNKFNDLCKARNLDNNDVKKVETFTKQYNKMVEHIFEKKLARGFGIFKKIFKNKEFKQDVEKNADKYKLNEQWANATALPKTKKPRKIPTNDPLPTETTQQQQNPAEIVHASVDIKSPKEEPSSLPAKEETIITSLKDWNIVKERMNGVESEIKTLVTELTQHIKSHDSSSLPEPKKLNATAKAKAIILAFDHKKLIDQIPITTRMYNNLDERVKLKNNLQIDKNDLYEMWAVLKLFPEVTKTICDLEKKMFDHCLQYPDDKIMAQYHAQAEKIRTEVANLVTQIHKVLESSDPLLKTSL